MRSLAVCFLAMIALLSSTWNAAAADNEAGWLNVRDFKASGSTFETPAATTAGSEAITLEGSSGVDTVLDVSSGDERAGDEYTGISTSCFNQIHGFDEPDGARAGKESWRKGTTKNSP